MDVVDTSGGMGWTLTAVIVFWIAYAIVVYGGKRN